MNLSSKQRAYLSSLASTINPIFNIGKASLTPEIIEALDAPLEKRKLIKLGSLKKSIDEAIDKGILLPHSSVNSFISIKSSHVKYKLESVLVF